MSYYFDLGRARFWDFVEGTDLLKGTHDTDLESTRGGVGGIPKYYIGGTYLGGRELRIGLSATF